MRVATDGWRVATSGLESFGGEWRGDDLAGHAQTGTQANMYLLEEAH